jgi:hypothetical protein
MIFEALNRQQYWTTFPAFILYIHWRIKLKYGFQNFLSSTHLHISLQTFQCHTNRTFSAEAWVADTFVLFKTGAPDTPCIAATVFRRRTFICPNEKEVSVVKATQIFSN